MAVKRTITKKPAAKKAAKTKTVRPPRVVRQLARFVTRLERMAERADVLKHRAAKRKNATAAAEAHDKAHAVLVGAKSQIETIAKGVGA